MLSEAAFIAHSGAKRATDILSFKYFEEKYILKKRRIIFIIFYSRVYGCNAEKSTSQSVIIEWKREFA